MKKERDDLMAVGPVLSLRKQLATHCFFVAHRRRADVLWSRSHAVVPKNLRRAQHMQLVI